MSRRHAIANIGLRVYLNSTKHFHNNLGYNDLKRLLDLPQPPSNGTLAKNFKVSKPTIAKWVGIFAEEQERKRK